MHTVYHAESLVDAHLVKDALEAQEIPAFISGEYLQGGIGELPARDFLKVMVPDGAAAKADDIVAQVRRDLEQVRQPDAPGIGGALPSRG